MKVKIREEPGRTVIHLAGDASAPEVVDDLRKALDRVLAERGQMQLVLDVSELHYLGSEGIGVIAAAYKVLSENCETLVLRDPTPQVARVLTVTRLEQYLRIERSDPPRPGPNRDPS